MRNKLRFFTPVLSTSMNSGMRYYSSTWKSTPFSTQHTKAARKTVPDDNKIIIYPPRVPIEEVKEISIEEKLAKDMRKVEGLMRPPSKPVSAKSLVGEIVTALEEHQKSGGSVDPKFYSKALMYYARA